MENALEVDESRFTGQGADLTLLHWLRQAEIAIETLPTDVLLQHLESLHAFWLKVLLPSPAPTLPNPGRPIRHLVARCVVKLHHRVESRSLFDLVQALVKAVADRGSKHMSAAENLSRVACWYCIGEVIKQHGANMMSFMAEICTSSVKVLRNTNLSVNLRTHAILAFSRSLYSAGKALPDALVKDLVKNLRSGLQDKALPVQRASAETFINLQIYTTACPLQPTLESITPLVLKSLETADHLTRRALSRLVAHFLAATQTPITAESSTEVTVVTSAAEDRTSKGLFTTAQMLNYLSVPYHKAGRKLRNAIIDVYATLISQLGSTYVEAHYAEIAQHLLDLVKPSSRFELLTSRQTVNILLRDLIGVRLLSEGGQVMAIREWTQYLKKWQPSPLPGSTPTPKHVLIVAVCEIGGLLQQIGNAPISIVELLAEPLVRLLSHDSYSVRLAAAHTLRQFCTYNPSQLPPILDILLEDITRDLSMLGTPTASKELPHRAIGKAFALSALLSISPIRPLYVSHGLSTRVFDLAVSLLKKAGDHDISVATVEVQIAWYLIAALMSLGEAFVKQNLPQLLVLWRNALPKPTSKDTSVGERGEGEWSFLLLVRECALTAVLNFLRHNSALVNIDVARRLATLFTNSLNFVNGFATAYSEALRDQAAPIFTIRPSLVEREANLRRRVLQCFTALGPSSATEPMQPALLQAAITVFADPENYSGSAAQAAIAAQAGHFTTVWQAVDGYAFGVSSLINAQGDELNRDRIESAIESQLSTPILGALEHDYVELFASDPSYAAPPQTGVIDAGVELFATLFPHQNQQGQVQSLATLSSHTRSGKLEKNPGRKQAVLANTVTALRQSLTRARKLAPQVSDLIKSLLQDAVLDPNACIRQSAAQAMGSLSAVSNDLSSQVQWLVDQVVNNRVPESRAGCALAFGSIYSNVGGLAGGPILKTIVNILMSLSTDPHPVVHFYAMSALAEVVNAANLSYEPFVPTTLGMLSNIYLLDTHEPNGGSLGSVNLRGDLPAYQVICRILHALIGVIGPELQEPGRIRDLVFLLVHEFGEETDEGLTVEAIKCDQQFLMFAPAKVDVPKLLQTFRTHLASTRRPLKVAAITALYQIVQRDAVLISKLGGNQLVEDLFGLLDHDPSLNGVKNVITSWLQQTAASHPSGWIDLCQRIMTRTVAAATPTAAAKPTAVPGFIDDEGESLGAESSAGSSLSSRWRTQLFALECIHNVVVAVADGGRREHFDPRLQGNPKQMLYSRVADLIRMAFSASAARVMEVRLAGLVVLRDVIERFAASADPDFDDALLLEQHQAPIAAALTPSFGSDSAPEVLALAVQVCAVFVGSGVVKEVGRMGRILKLLTNALEQCKDGNMDALGDVHNLSANAAIMLQVSVLTAWAELQIASTRQAYLVKVLDPYRWLLGPYWIGALRDYARLRTDPESGVDLHNVGRDVLLPYYVAAVPKLLDATAISLAASDPYTLGAMDGQAFTTATLPTISTAPRLEPVANFYIIYGLAFESLVKALGEDDNTMAQVCLKVMQTLVRPSLCGPVFEGAFFDELCTIAYRVGMSGSAAVKTEMVELIKAFVVGRHEHDAAQTRRALAIVTFTLRAAIPSRDTRSNFGHGDSLPDRLAFFKAAYGAFGKIIDFIEPGQRTDLRAVGIHLFGDLLADETVDYAGSSLPVLKMLLDQTLAEPNADRVIHGLLSACLGNIDDMRTRVTRMASIKIKNNLLAVTLVLTSLPPSVKVSRVLVEELCYSIGQHLEVRERPELGLTGIHCASTLLQAAVRTPPSPVVQHVAVHLLAPLITYLAEAVAESAVSEQGAPVQVEGVKQVVKALVTWTSGLADETRARGYGVLLPTLTLLLDPETAETAETAGQNGQAAPLALHAIATTTMLGLAQSYPAAFRDATQAMEETERARLEKAVRGALGGSRETRGAPPTAEKKAIELRSFG